MDAPVHSAALVRRSEAKGGGGGASCHVAPRARGWCRTASLGSRMWMRAVLEAGGGGQGENERENRWLIVLTPPAIVKAAGPRAQTDLHKNMIPNLCGFLGACVRVGCCELFVRCPVRCVCVVKPKYFCSSVCAPVSRVSRAPRREIPSPRVGPRAEKTPFFGRQVSQLEMRKT